VETIIKLIKEEEGNREGKQKKMAFAR